MKRTIFVGLIILTCLLSCIVYASEAGMFEGFKVINVNVNGAEVKGDTPAILFNERTMVPIRFVSEALGATVSWDDKTNTAIINSTQNSDIAKTEDELKAYSTILYHYQTLENFSELLDTYNSGLGIAADEIDDFNRTAFLDSSLKNAQVTVLDSYNVLKSDTEDLIAYAQSYNLDTSNMNTIVNNYKTVIDKYFAATDNLKSYSEAKYFGNSFYNLFLDNRGQGFDTNLKTKKICNDAYDNWYAKLINY